MQINVASLAASVMAAISAGCAQAQDPDVATFLIDPTHTHVQFSVDRFGFNDMIADFTGVSGEISLDFEAPENSRVNAAIDVATVYAGDATREEHVRGPFWLNAEQFRLITFASTSVEVTGDTTAMVTGDLTILGVTNPVVLDVVLNQHDTDPATRRDAVGFSATTSLRRSDFGHTIAAPKVGDDIEIRIEVLAHVPETEE